MAQMEYDTQSITDAVIARLADCQDPRFKQVMTSLIGHLHAFARDVDLKGDEWFKAIEFLTACGKACDDKRQEFILLSDTLGLSMLVVALEHARALKGRSGATPPTDATVQGPFYWEGAPELPLGSDIAEGVAGEPALYSGRVTDLEGQPCKVRCSTCGPATARVCTTCSAKTAACGRGRASAPTPRAATGSGRSAPPATPCPTTGRWATCCARWAAIPTAPATST
jgi:hypothetical protein